MSDELPAGSPNTMAIIEEHKKLAIISKNLSDFHLENLKMYPRILIDEIDHFVLDYNIDFNSAKGLIRYDVLAKKIPTDEEKKKILDVLKQWVGTLLWPEIDVVLEFKGEK